jgi:2,4'-dihydroxyacetophenone dioxygenase
MMKAFGPTHIDAESLPWFPFTPYSQEVLLKIFHVDPVRGEATLMLKAPGGADLGVHNHYGRVLVYTVQGSWRYEEHDWVAKPGHFVYEVANSQHTFHAEPGEEVLLFIHVEGPLEFLDAAGNSVAIETARTLMDRYQAYCADRGIEPVDVTQFAPS